ncbi:PAS domain S-box protein [Methanogenium marinum]|uniref:histidine kinase n=1 Tax=Methanogenium marinum TaxID=348610 RepID=A0A9Q4PX18_9EURY|nr:PAS domain S-box protein [Methanogenium marinum]MDE4908081.1 PAS domain S-box protein [Methanogenium marinum]
MRVLYIDNDEDFLYTAAKCLSDTGSFHVDVSSSSVDALLKLKENRYDAIISEHVIPAIDGIGILKDLRLAGDAIPFIFFTAYHGENTAIEALNAGADYYLRKDGFSSAQQEVLINILHRLGAGKRASCPPVPLQSELRMILDSSDEPTVFTGLDHVILWANKSYIVCHGAESHGVVGRHCYEVGWGRDVPCAYCRVSEVISTGKSVSSEIAHPDGRFTWITAYPVTDNEGRVCGFVEKETDITAIKKSQEAVRQEKEKYNLLIQSASDMIYLYALLPGGNCGRILDVNAAACRRMGYSREEFLQMVATDIDDPDIEQFRDSLIYEVGEMGHFIFEWQHVTKEGGAVPVEVSVNHFMLDGAPVALSVVRDITERKVSERALRMREQEYRDLVENIDEVIFRIDPEGNFTYLSPAIGKMAGGAGYSPSELIGKNFIDYIYPADQPMLQRHFRERLLGITKKSTFRLVTKAGNERWVLESSRPIREDGAVVGVQGVFLDITDLKQMGAALRKANKKLNILSSITRHDILNQITAMNLYLELIEGDSEDSGRLKEFFEATGKIMGNLERIITFTRMYEDLGVNEPEWQDIGAIVEQEMIPVSGGLTVKNEVHGYEVYADSMLGKVFSNLMGNSVMHGGDAHGVTVLLEVHGAEVCILVADDGAGIPTDMKEKIFQKGVGKNTGFGLFLSREILDLTGLSIREIGLPGVGACFEIHVPEGNVRYVSGA